MKKKIILTTVAIFLTLTIIVFFFKRLHNIIEIQISKQVVNSQILLAVSGGEQINNIFETAENLLLSLANSYSMQKYFPAKEKNNIKEIKFWGEPLMHILNSSIRDHNFMAQLRVIDSLGQEVVRLDRKGGKIIGVETLQDKSAEFYFSEAMKMEPGQFYISPITLNREFGEIEIPHREMIRIATVVMGEQHKSGIVIMNIDMNMIYDIIDRLSEHAWLFDSSGKLLNCSIGLPREDHEKVIELILQGDETSFNLPLDHYQTGDRSVVSYFPIDVFGKNWYVVSELPFDEISNIMSKSNKARLALFGIILISFAGVLIYFYRLYYLTQRSQLKAQMAEDLLHLNKKLEQKSAELEKANYSLEEMDIRKTDFLNMVAHDLRTPLTAIRSYSDLLLRYKNQPAKVTDEYAGIIKEESVRLSNLIDNCLDVSKIEAGLMEYKFEDVDIGSLVAHFTKLFHAEGMAQKIGIKSEVEKDLPLVKGDKEKLGQVFSNLLNNAMKFTPKKGSIVIKAFLTTISKEGMESPCVEVSIEDTGIGIPKEMQGKIFEKFVQLGKRDIKSTRGVGLGLAICKDIVKNHRGKIKVESDEGQGTKFSFTLRISEKQLSGDLLSRE